MSANVNMTQLDQNDLPRILLKGAPYIILGCNIVWPTVRIIHRRAMVFGMTVWLLTTKHIPIGIIAPGCV